MIFSVVFDAEGWTRVEALIVAKAPWHGRVPPTSVKVTVTPNQVKAASGSPLAGAGFGLSPSTGTRIVAESGRLGESQGDATDPVHSNYTHGAGAGAERSASRYTAE